MKLIFFKVLIIKIIFKFKKLNKITKINKVKYTYLLRDLVKLHTLL